MLPIIRTSISYAGIAARRIRHRHSLPDLPSQISPPLESEISAEQLETTKIPVDPQLEGRLQEAFASGSVQKAMTSQKSNLKLNPSVLWTILVKGKRQQSEQAGEEGLSTTIEKANISLEMEEALSNAGLALQESGWGWLTYDSRSNILKLTTYASQNDPTAEKDLIPLLESLFHYQKFVLMKFF